MKKTRIKRYVIHILAVNGLGNDTVDLPERSAVIFCTKRTGLFLPWLEPWQILHIPFEDYEDRNLPGCFTRTHARMITRFIQGLPDTVTDLYVCCSKGGSRSPAVAAALLRASGRSDMPVWRNPFYVPNTLVYMRLCREFGLPVGCLSTWIRLRINSKEFKKAQKKGKTTKHERWELLE